MYMWFFVSGGVLAAIIIVIVLFIVMSREGEIGEVIFFYDRVVPIEASGILPKLEESLRRMGVLAVIIGDKLIVQDIVYWEISEVESKGKTYLNLRAGTKTWYFILTVILLVVFLVIGILLGIFAYWKFITVKDKIKLVLVEEAGDPSIVNLI